MKKGLNLIIIAVTILFVVSIVDSMAVEIKKEKSRVMLEQGDRALMEKDFNAAKLYYKQAIQYDPFNKVAMDKYENLIRITATNTNIDLSVFGNVKPKKDVPNSGGPAKTENKQSSPAPKPKLEFQGC